MMFNTGDLILDAVILSIVARTPEGTYGYKITQDVRSKMDVPESTFYPLLKQMQMDGYLEVYHKDFGGRSRRFYKITESGKERLEFCQQNWTNYLQNASALLMNGGAQESAAAPQTAQPQAPQMQAPAPQQQIQQPAAMGNDFDFSIGGDEPVADSDNALFEFETFTAEPVAEQTVYQESSVPEQPSYQETAYSQTASVEQPVAYEEPVMPEPQAVNVAPVPEITLEPEAIPSNDEADFLAEMPMGDDGEVAPLEEAGSEPDDTTVSEFALDIEGIENTFSESAELSELENLISQLRSFERVMSQRPADTTVSEAATASENVAIKDINGVASLLSAAPAPSTNTEQPASQSVSTPPQTASAPVDNTDTSHTPTIRYKEVRNPDTDDSVNSLVDLLKDDQPKKKSRFFRGWGSKKSSGAAQYAVSSAPSPKVETAPANQTTPAPAEPVKKVDTPVPAMAYQEVKKPENNSIPNVPNAAPPVSAKAPEPVPAVKPAPARPVASRTVREVEDNNSVDSLVELLKGDTASKPVSIFGKASAKSYTKVTAQKNTEQPSTDTAAIPKPSVSEPKVFKPTASKTFEEKAASPNARPVETTATITKALDAKAISTKPAAAKPAEAKSVETKAVVTPKPEAAPAATAETPQEEAPMDAFKARLLQAHLLPDEK